MQSAGEDLPYSPSSYGQDAPPPGDMICCQLKPLLLRLYNGAFFIISKVAALEDGQGIVIPCNTMSDNDKPYQICR
jgi:hypothetical protein